MKYFLSLLWAMAACSLFAQEFTGKWYAYPDLKSERLRLCFEILQTGNGYSVDLEIPDLSGKHYAGKGKYEDYIFTLTVPECGMVCHVKWRAGGQWAGSIVRNGHTFPLVLTREPVVFKRPQTPRPPFPYRSEEVIFRNNEAGINLAGTLTLPDTTGPFRAVILISGSGPQNRDGELFEHKPFLLIADYLARRGIATLRFDDRGTGQSEGDFGEASIPEFETDVEAAIQYLKNRPEILKEKIGVAGHSEGGFVAYALAARQEVAFVVTLAAGGVKGQELLLMQRAALLKASGAKEDFIRQYNSYMQQAQEVAIQTANVAACERRLQELFAGTLLERQAAETARQLHNPGMLGLLMYDPEDDFPKITCPVLALNGDKDCRVPVGNLEYIRKGLAEHGNTQVTVIPYSGLNHMFQTARTGLPVEYSDIEETFSPVVLKDMADWILKQ